MTGVMNPLEASSLGLALDEVLAGTRAAPRLFIGHSPDGQRWLAALITDHPAGQRWLCAPHSELDMNALRTGRALPTDLFLHSGNGTFEMIALQGDGGISEVRRLCRELTDDELSCIPRLALTPQRARRRGSNRAVRPVVSSSSAFPQPA